MPTENVTRAEIPNLVSEGCVVGNNEDQEVNETQHLLSTEKKSQNWLLANYIQEFVIFFYMFAFALTITCNTNLNMDKACTLVFNRTTVECYGNDTHLVNEVQVVANNFNLYASIMRVIPSSILGIFIGPWSDKYGRKPPIYFAMTGTILSSGVMIWYAATSQTPLYFSIIAAIPEGICGSMIGVLSSLYTMASESTNNELRTLKYTTLQLSILISLPLGIFLGGVIYERYQYTPVYSLSCACNIVSLLIFLFSKDESEKAEATLKRKLKDFFKCDSIKEIVKIIARKRENKGRTQIILLMFSMTVIILNYVAVESILYLFCKKMFRWTMTYYSEVSAVAHVSEGIFVIVFASALKRMRNVSDAWMGLLGVLSLFAQSVLKAFSFRTWMYFTATALGLPGSMGTISIRSRLSKIIHNNELGKVFSVLAIVESFIPLLGSLMVTLLYNASVEFFPGLTILLAGILVLFPAVVFVWILRLPNHSSNDVREICNDLPGPESQESEEKLIDVNSITTESVDA